MVDFVRSLYKSEDEKTRYSVIDIATEGNALDYLIRKSILDNVNTLTLVEVSRGDYDNTGLISVRTVSQKHDSNGGVSDTTYIENIPYMQWQYGYGRIVSKPEPGDIGFILTSKNELTLDKRFTNINKHFNLGDSIYIGGISTASSNPGTTIEIDGNGIKVTSNQKVEVKAGEVNIDSRMANISATTQLALGNKDATLGVALQGMKVTSNGTPSGSVVGYIAEGSAIVKSI